MYRRSSGGGGCARLGIALLIALVSIAGYFFTRSENPITGETQHVDLTPREEIALGLQAVPEMVQQFGGQSSDQQAQALVDEVGQRLVAESAAANSPYQFEFHLLDDDQTINAFALPGGQIFITEALLSRLQTEGQLAGVLGHEVGHVIERHSAERIAKQRLTQGLTGAAVLATYDPEDPNSRASAAVVALIGNLVNMKYGREDELESDEWGVCVLQSAGYDPQEMIRVMEILAEANQGQAPPEFFSTHPNPENRVGRIQQAIQAGCENGIPRGVE